MASPSSQISFSKAQMWGINGEELDFLVLGNPRRAWKWEENKRVKCGMRGRKWRGREWRGEVRVLLIFLTFL
jgi:hypothetical protein